MGCDEIFQSKERFNKLTWSVLIIQCQGGGVGGEGVGRAGEAPCAQAAGTNDPAAAVGEADAAAITIVAPAAMRGRGRRGPHHRRRPLVVVIFRDGILFCVI